MTKPIGLSCITSIFSGNASHFSKKTEDDPARLIYHGIYHERKNYEVQKTSNTEKRQEDLSRNRSTY